MTVPQKTAGILYDEVVYPEDGGDMSLRSVGLYSDYTVLRLRRPIFIVTAVRSINQAGVWTFEYRFMSMLQL
jgi:hypothetical protein